MGKTFEQCRICGNQRLTPVLNIGDLPISSVFPKPTMPDPPVSSLEMVLCDGPLDADICHLLQLKISADVSDMYGATYGYASSTSPLMVTHLTKKVEELAQLVKLKSDDVVLDIGCNDGTLLNHYQQYSVKRLGCDPSSKKFKDNFQKDIKVIYDFFSKETIQPLLTNKKCKIITSIAMFYDLDEPQRFVNDVSDCLSDDGIWALELSYLPLFLTNLSYDQICHEHVAYYGLRQLKWLAEKAGLTIVDVSFNEMNGGSFYILAGKSQGPYKPKQTFINKILESETPLVSFNTYKKFKNRILSHKDESREFLKLVKEAGKSVIGYGASTKGNIMLHFCNITEKDLPSICDAQSQKWGSVTPGTRIPIISKKEMRERKPDYLFVFIWHLRKEVIQQEMDYINSGGKLIFPLPRLHIVDKNNYQRYCDSNLDELAYQL